MPRKRKGVAATSFRHIRRLAKQRTANDLQKCNTSCSLPCNNASDAEIPADSISEPSILVSNSLSSANSITEPALLLLSNSLSSGDLITKSALSLSNSLSSKNSILQGQVSEEPSDIAFHQLSFKVDCAPCANANYIQNEQNNVKNVSTTDYSGLDVIDSDDCSSVSSDDYRYNDSGADSIPDSDVEDIDIVYVIENLEANKNQEFVQQLSHWAKEYQINHNALKALLLILNQYTETRFPKDPRTLLNTPKYIDITDMDNGQYCHFGVEKYVKKIIDTHIARKMEYDKIKLLVNIDGAPIVGSSSEKGLWVILIKDSELNSVYLGVYCGTKKPEDHNIFLKKFADELTELITNGLVYNNKLSNVRLHGLICDAPAKSFVLCTKYHSGYFSCSKCLIEGEYSSSICFPIERHDDLEKFCNDQLRSDLKCKNLEYIGEYQRGETVFSQLPHFGLVSNVPLDCMHLVYLGVMKQLLRHWIGDKGKKNKIYRLSNEQIEVISRRLEDLKNILPSDFNRRSRSLRYWKHWKATEFRHLLLYFGSFIFKDILNADVYNNFLKLHISMLIISNKMSMKSVNIRYAESLILQFVFDFQKIYGKHNVTHNVHNLLHLCKDVQNYGTVENFSAFPFENYICSLKKLIRKGDKPLQQIVRRLSVYQSIIDLKSRYNTNEVEIEKLHYHGIVTYNTRTYEKQYKVLITKTFRIDISDERNNCVMLVDGSIINVLNIGKSNNMLYIIGKNCEKKEIYLKHQVFEVVY